jgi:ribonuclease HII
VLRPGDAKRLEGLTDSKLLSAQARDHFYDLILARAVDHAVVVISPEEIDRRGVHLANVDGMRRAVARLNDPPGYVLTDGFAVRGFGRPALAVPKGDQVAACVAAASVLAKVTRDRLMIELDAHYPQYGFAEHKGYNTPAHEAALVEHGPSPVHRFSFVNVRSRRLPVQASDTGFEPVSGVGSEPGLMENEGLPELLPVGVLDLGSGGGVQQ